MPVRLILPVASKACQEERFRCFASIPHAARTCRSEVVSSGFVLWDFLFWNKYKYGQKSRYWYILYSMNAVISPFENVNTIFQCHRNQIEPNDKIADPVCCFSFALIWYFNCIWHNKLKNFTQLQPKKRLFTQLQLKNIWLGFTRTGVSFR